MQKVREVQIAQKVVQIVRCKEKRVDLKENGAGRPHRRWGAERQTVEYADDVPERKLGVNLTCVGKFQKTQTVHDSGFLQDVGSRNSSGQ